MMPPSGVEAESLEEVLEQARAQLAEALPRVLADLLSGVDERVAGPIRYAIEGGGKRLRPVLCLVTYQTLGGRCPAAADFACALELIHTYSLIHDDLPCMDDDDLRRGRPTAHRAFGIAPAVVAGTALIPLAVAATLQAAGGLGLGEGAAAALVGELCRAAGGGGMVGGQWLDLAAEGRAVSLAQLESIHAAKTGALLAVAPRLGALAAGAPARLVAAVGEYGRHLGLAFQIADDLLDVTGTDASLGKSAGRDQALRKATYPALLGLEAARARARAQADAAVAALRAQDLRAPALEALARYAVERDH
jgi:geranylgeranyl diphosphate synthase type II